MRSTVTAFGCRGGEVVSLRRGEISVLSHYQADGLAEARHPMDEHDLWRCVIYRCVVGSRAYGLDHDESDVDRRGVYLPPAEMHWSLYGVPEQLENTETDECYWELQKFLMLALKANPNVLEVLYSPPRRARRPPSAGNCWRCAGRSSASSSTRRTTAMSSASSRSSAATSARTAGSAGGTRDAPDPPFC